MAIFPEKTASAQQVDTSPAPNGYGASSTPDNYGASAAPHELAVEPTAPPAAIHTPEAVPPPAYEKTASGVHQVPRNDDIGREEMAYHANPQQTMVVTHLQDLRYDPALIDCPFCQQRIVSDVRKTESDTTWIYTLLCCLCCGCIGALFPILLGWGNDSEHFCTSCKNRVARVPHEGGSGQTQTFGPAPPNGVVAANGQTPVNAAPAAYA